MVSNIVFQSTHIEKWSITFRKAISITVWEFYHSIIFKCTIETKMKCFEYRLLLEL